MKLDKNKLLVAIREKLEAEMAILKTAAQATFEAATHEESKPENEYDTRGLEASYLAGAQAKRVAEIEKTLAIYKFIEIKNFAEGDPISSTALVEVDLNGRHSFIFVMSNGGGLILQFDGHPIQVVTPASPLGEALLGLKVGDTATVEVGTQVREYEVLSVE
jgi:transcription elongation GreA/GreB family factor